MCATMLKALLESSVQGCKLRVVVGSCAGLSDEQCTAEHAAVAGRRGSRCTPMVNWIA